MEIVYFSDIKDDLISHIRRRMLIPIIGSGFTKGCRSINGQVPSGDEYRKYMVDEIIKTNSFSDHEQKKLSSDPFSMISGIYQKVIPADERRKYLKDNFTKVCIEENKKNLLSLPWPYIYTLNIDDGIEEGSEYNTVVYANRDVVESIFDERSCVIKLHGDVAEIITYADSQSSVFSQMQYVTSLETNNNLLTKLKNDSDYNNLIFIGCSLDDELDLLKSLNSSKDREQNSITSKYVCIVDEPTTLDILKYENYGITHCIKFDSYDDIYEGIYSAGLEAEQITIDDLENRKAFEFQLLPSTYEINKPYFFFGKSLISREHTINLPYFFITRDITPKIIENFSMFPLQFLIGSGCSGKSYILADIAQKIRDRDVFLFETKDRLSTKAFNQLITKKNCILLADNTAFSILQIEYLLQHIQELRSRKISIAIVAGKNDRELNNQINLKKIYGCIKENDFTKIDISNSFSDLELGELNPKLTAVNIGIFSSGNERDYSKKSGEKENEKRSTIIDNIIYASEKLMEKNQFSNNSPCFSSMRNIAALIALATERKIYSKRAIELDLAEELDIQWRRVVPLIDKEVTWSFERSKADNSPIKYVINAEHWLYSQLNAFISSGNHERIVEAYKYIISRIIIHEGKPEVFVNSNDKSYKNYILFDNINRIFNSSSIRQKIALSLIREIYEGLNDSLSTDPNYKHQQAKAYLHSSYAEQDAEQKIRYLDQAYRASVVAEDVFNERYRENRNDKILISVAHIHYTQAIILCHLCKANEYKSINKNSEAIAKLYEALISPYNNFEYVQKDSRSNHGIIDNILDTMSADSTLIDSDQKKPLEHLLNNHRRKDSKF